MLIKNAFRPKLPFKKHFWNCFDLEDVEVLSFPLFSIYNNRVKLGELETRMSSYVGVTNKSRNDELLELELDLGALELVEKGLRYRLSRLFKEQLNSNPQEFCNRKEISKIQTVLGKLHDQKIWYRPHEGTYISG